MFSPDRFRTRRASRFLALVAGGICLFLPSPALSENTMDNSPTALDLSPELRDVYARWVKGPGAMLGFWFAPDRKEVRDRTGANAYSLHKILRVAMTGPEGDQPVVFHDFHAPRKWLRMGFVADRPVSGVRIRVSTAFDGAGGTVRLARVVRDGTESTVAEIVQSNARADDWLTVSPGSATPLGRYVVEIRPARKRVEVWPGAAARPTTWIEDPDATQPRQPGVAFLATVLYADGTTESLRADAQTAICLSVGDFDPLFDGASLSMNFGVGLGEHNNPFFVWYNKDFVRAHPSAFMADAAGQPILTGKGGNLVPAVDDALLTRLADESIRAGVAYFGRVSQLRYWVIAGEESYPDYFGLPPGDFRADSIRHYKTYRAARGDSAPRVPEIVRPTKEAPPAWPAGFEPGTPDHDRWKEFREAAMEERAAHYMQTFLSADSTRPILYPTHGNPFFSFGRGALGHDPGGIVRACDGFETGQITLDGDAEELNLLTLAHMTSCGKPVETPRLANKTLDPAARGGGRTFAPAMLRRLVMECVGMGVGHVGLVKWIGDLPDGEWHIRDTPAEDEARRVFAELLAAAPYLAGMSRLQPRVALYASDAAWRRDGWNPAWTGFFQDALARHWQTTVVGDSLVDRDLATRTPVLVCLETPTVARASLPRIQRYLNAGGRLFVWGDFARRDEYGQTYADDHPDRAAIAAHPGLVRIAVSASATETTRVLVSQSSTPFGAHVETRQYTPAPFDAIKRGIAEVLPAGAIRPIDVASTGGRICCLSLTDGATLMTVLINRAAEPADVSIRVNDAKSGGQNEKGEWIYREIPAGSATPKAPSTGTWKSTIPPNGTVAVWIYRQAATKDSAARDRARTVLAAFARLGCDTVHLQAYNKLADDAAAAGIAVKRDALAARIVDALGVRIVSGETKAGDLDLSARVYDSRGHPVGGAVVTAGLVPGDGRAIEFRESKSGHYEATIAYKDRPRMYDVERGVYDRLAGSARLVIHARSGRREGGAITTVVHRRRPSGHSQSAKPGPHRSADTPFPRASAAR